MIKIYAASRASIPERGQMWRKYRENGSCIVSSWIDAKEEVTAEFLIALWIRIEQEIRNCDRLVLYIEKGDLPLKGAFVEVGIAIGLGKPVFIMLKDIELDMINLNPIGSWASHPLVKFIDNLDEVMF